MEEHYFKLNKIRDWRRGFIVLLQQAVILPGSEAGSDGVEPASGFVIQNRQASCFMLCPM